MYQVDLDSVYEIPGSNRPVYKLAKYQMQVRNQFELLVQVEFSDDEVSDHVKSKPFMIKTKSNNDEPAGIIQYCAFSSHLFLFFFVLFCFFVIAVTPTRNVIKNNNIQKRV